MLICDWSGSGRPERRKTKNAKKEIFCYSGRRQGEFKVAVVSDLEIFFGLESNGVEAATETFCSPGNGVAAV